MLRRLVIAVVVAVVAVVGFQPVGGPDMLVAPVSAEDACDDEGNCEGQNQSPPSYYPYVCRDSQWSFWDFIKWVFTGNPC